MDFHWLNYYTLAVPTNPPAKMWRNPAVGVPAPNRLAARIAPVLAAKLSGIPGRFKSISGIEEAARDGRGHSGDGDRRSGTQPTRGKSGPDGLVISKWERTRKSAANLKIACHRRGWIALAVKARRVDYALFCPSGNRPNLVCWERQHQD
jgi:hypothetical protein